MKRVLILSNHFITLYSFRKELITCLVKEGDEVFLSLPESPESHYFSSIGCQIIPTEIDRRGVNPINDIKLLRFYRKMIPQINPDIVFSYTIKPNIYGAMVTNKLKYRQVCNITGMGGTFLNGSLLRTICIVLYKISVRQCYKVFFQNTDNRDFFIQHKMIGNNWGMLPGSGCNLQEHTYAPMPSSETVKFIFIGRVMKLKGIDEYLECARIVKAEYPNTVFYIAGWNEEDKYKRIVEEYQREGVIDYIGFRQDIADWIAKCHCTILPSHGGEGVPNVLLESAAAGRACIASKISGSTDVIEDGVTGYLFETGSSASLAEKVKCFMQLTDDQRAQMGIEGRKKIEQKFDRNIVINAYLDELRKIDMHSMKSIETRLNEQGTKNIDQ